MVKKDAMDSIFQESIKNKVKLMKALLKLKNQAEPKYLNAKKLSPCSFIIEEASLEPGVCTYSGACRFQGEDYMYQGGCGHHSGWGSSIISTTMECSMMVTRSREVQGKCTRSGHCWKAFEINLFHKKCRRMLSWKLTIKVSQQKLDIAVLKYLIFNKTKCLWLFSPWYRFIQK